MGEKGGKRITERHKEIFREMAVFMNVIMVSFTAAYIHQNSSFSL